MSLARGTALRLDYSRLTDRRGKPEIELETRRVVEHFDSRAVKMCDGRDHAEPQTVSRRVAAVFKPVKALEDLLVSQAGIPGPSSAIEMTCLPSMFSVATTT